MQSEYTEFSFIHFISSIADLSETGNNIELSLFRKMIFLLSSYQFFPIMHCQFN